MLICNCCLTTFPNAILTSRVVTNPNSPACGPAEYGCPKCKNNDYDEAVICQGCGEFSQAEYCTHCKEDLKKCDSCGDYFPVSQWDKESGLCADCLAEENKAKRIEELKAELKSLGVTAL